MSLMLAMFALLLPQGGAVGSPQAGGLMASLQARAAEHVLVVAHRGDSDGYPENTLPAFRSAVHITAELVELDVYQSADGEFFCFHDETVDRTTNAVRELGRKGVRCVDLTLAELAELDAGAWKGERHGGTRIPTLEEALDAILPGSTPLIEHKGGDAAALVELLRRKDVVDRVVVQSFDWDVLAEVHRIEPRIALGALGSGRFTMDHLARLLDLGVEMIHWSHRDLRAEDVRLLRRKGFLVLVYTVNFDIGLAGASALGIHGVTTDDPNRLKGLIRLGYVTR